MQKEEVEKNTYETLLACVIALAAIVSSYVLLAYWWANILHSLFNIDCSKLLLGIGLYLSSCVLERNYAWFWIIASFTQCYIWLSGL
jgi:hypothetical protein